MDKAKSELFLGYGSPGALEEAIKAGQGEDFVVYGEGLCYSSVCSSLPQETVEARMKARPCGTTHGWLIVTEKGFSGGEPNPCPCNKYPETHRHFLFEA